jgi:dipeptidyl aminopeptidase/acylaminoacyl peptidase
MSELFHECGVAAVYHLPHREPSPLAPPQGPDESSRLISRLLLDIQNRGQLAAGMTSYHPSRSSLINTHKDVGTVTEVFRLNHQRSYERLMRKYAGQAAIGHCRYATCGKDDRSYAQPFERHHLQKHKWFSFAFNGQLANYAALRDKPATTRDGVTLPAAFFRPRAASRRLPVVVLPHGGGDRGDCEWYVDKARAFARDGYVAIIYTARGHGRFPGLLPRGS